MAFCDRCNRVFGSEHALDKHITYSKAHWMCWPCGLDFYSHDDLVEHYRESSEHWWCDEGKPGCGLFDSRSEYMDHCKEKHWFCLECLTVWPSEMSLNYHIGESHDYCSECRRFFRNGNNLRMHLNSKLHRIPRVSCFGAPTCKQTFISLSDALLHIENGHCPSGLTRDNIKRYVVAADKTNIITNPARLIGYNDSSSNTRYIASDRSQRPDGWWQCALCTKIFRFRGGLNAHYASAAHQAKIFRCPNSNRGCKKEFNALSGLLQHMEDGNCGAMQAFQDNMDKLMQGVSRLRLTY